MNPDKDSVKHLISRIRRDIGHKDVEPDIRAVVWDENSRELVIITSDRPGKSTVIGKGGWVAGRLKEELGVKSVHVEAYTDLMVRRYRMELARDRLDQIRSTIPTPALTNLAHLLEERIEKPYALETLLENYEEQAKDSSLSVVALSGGVDSSFSLILAQILGFQPRAVTVDPGSIILPGYFKNCVDDLTQKLHVLHEYLPLDMKEVIQESLEGRYHPCGRCSKLIEKTVLSYAQKMGARFLFYGDLLSTGADSLNCEGDILRINLPALLSATKGEVKGIARRWGVEKKAGYGCPLLKEVQKKHPSMRRYSIQRIERETRAGVLEPGEALDMIMRLI
jgi:predicted PP-loop superfamily ATPase